MVYKDTPISRPKTFMRHILLVEDDVHFGKLFKRYFASPNTRITIVKTVKECVKYLDNDNGIHVIVSDMNLPGENGVDLWKILKDKYDKGQYAKKYHKMLLLTSACYETMNEAEALHIDRIKKPDDEQEWFLYIRAIEQKITITDTILDVKATREDIHLLRQEFNTMTSEFNNRMEANESMLDKMAATLEEIKDSILGNPSTAVKIHEVCPTSSDGAVIPVPGEVALTFTNFLNIWHDYYKENPILKLFVEGGKVLLVTIVIVLDHKHFGILKGFLGMFK